MGHFPCFFSILFLEGLSYILRILTYLKILKHSKRALLIDLDSIYLALI